MSLFRLDASIRLEGSHSRTLADRIEGQWRSSHADEPVTRRDVGLHPLPAEAWSRAVNAGSTSDAERSAPQRAALELAGQLSDELLEADRYLFATPLYNFGVSQHLKAWVDLVTTDPRMKATDPLPLEGRPAVLVVVRGGAYGPGTPRDGWDHATGWIRRILADVWKLDLRVVEEEFTLVGVNPALDEFRDLAATLRTNAARAATEAGDFLAGARINA